MNEQVRRIQGEKLTFHRIIQSLKDLNVWFLKDSHTAQCLATGVIGSYAAKHQYHALCNEQASYTYEGFCGGHIHTYHKRQVHHNKADGIALPVRAIDDVSQSFFNMGDGAEEKES